jgi:uroporphyrinogen-III decarboxylase
MDPTAVYTIMYTNPEVIKILFEKMLDAFFRIRDYLDAKLGIKNREEIGLANDNSAFISNKMYRQMVLPYDKAIYEKYGKKSRYLHADGPNDHNFKTFAEELKLTFMDIGGFSSIETAVRNMKGKIVIHGGLNNKDLYQGLTEATKKKIENAIRLAAPGGGYEFAIGGETYPGVAPTTLIELVKYVKKVGKYPIAI